MAKDKRLQTATFNVRPGIHRVHTFRSHVRAMRKHPDGKRLIVVLASGKAYISNAKMTRWRKLSSRAGDASGR